MRTDAGLALIRSHPELIDAVLLIEEEAVEYGMSMVLEALPKTRLDVEERWLFALNQEGSETE